MKIARMLALIHEPFDWAKFLAMAAVHRVGTHVYRSLRTLPPGSIPENVLEELQGWADENRRRVVRNSLEITRIDRHFRAAGFPLTLLKGLALAQTVYGDPAARRVGDLDLLTSLRDLPAKLLLMEELGYTVVNPACRLTPGPSRPVQPPLEGPDVSSRRRTRGRPALEAVQQPPSPRQSPGGGRPRPRAALRFRGGNASPGRAVSA